MDALIVEDEKNSYEVLNSLIQNFCPLISSITWVKTVDEAVVRISKTVPEIIFLDVNLNDENGFDLLERVKPIVSSIIFVSAYSEYAIRAFKFSALDYLLKPLDIVELRSAVDRASKSVSHEQSQYSTFLRNIRAKSVDNFTLALPTFEGIIFVKVRDILYCQAESNYTCFYLLNKSKILVSYTLKHYEELLSESNFFRIHHAYLINLDYVKEFIRKDGGYVTMINGVKLEVAKRRREDFFDKFTS
jgi:two-component system LytT family response regulator